MINICHSPLFKNNNAKESNIMRSNNRNRLLLSREVRYELFLLPALIGYAVFFIYPVACSFYYSVTDWTLNKNHLFLQDIAFGFSIQGFG